VSHPDLEIYPDELFKIQGVQSKLERQFEFTPIKGDADKTIFEMAVHNEFGEIGFQVSITWQQIYHKEVVKGNEIPVPTGMWLPGIEIIGRNKVEQEHDHDRHKWGVVKGLADGQPGYVREDGTYREDPLKKIILPKIIPS
jgi:hypothetical protein